MDDGKKWLREATVGILIVGVFVLGASIATVLSVRTPPALLPEPTEIRMNASLTGILTFSASAEGMRLETERGSYVVKDGFIVEYLPEVDGE